MAKKQRFTKSSRKQTLWRLSAVHGWFCWYCGIPVGPNGTAVHIDHIVPKARGGDDGFFNLALACSRCNYAKRDSTVDEFLWWLRWVKSGAGQTVKTIYRFCEEKDVQTACEGVQGTISSVVVS